MHFEFINAYNTAPRNLQQELRETIQMSCNWKSRATFYNKGKGKIRLTDDEVMTVITAFKRLRIHLDIKIATKNNK